MPSRMSVTRSFATVSRICARRLSSIALSSGTPVPAECRTRAVPAPCRSPRRSFALPAGAVLLLAAALRLAGLADLPGGLHFDLAANLFDALDVLDGARPIYFPRNNGR